MRTTLRALLLLIVFAALVGGVLVGCDSESMAQTLPDGGMIEVNGASIHN